MGPREGWPLSWLSLLCCVTAVAARRSAPSDRARRLHMLHKGGRPRPVLEHMLQPLRALPNGLTLILGPPRSHILGPGLCRLAGRHFSALRMLTLGVLCILKRSRRPLDHMLPPEKWSCPVSALGPPDDGSARLMGQVSNFSASFQGCRLSSSSSVPTDHRWPVKQVSAVIPGCAATTGSPYLPRLPRSHA
jgi:hypothetical protein